MLNRKHTNTERKNMRKTLKWILIDSATIGGIAMFASMPAIVPTTPVEAINGLYVMLKAFGGAFFLQLAVERGLKRGE